MKNSPEKYLENVKHKTIISIIGSVFLIVSAISKTYWISNKWIAFPVASIIQFWCARHFYLKAWRGFYNRNANMYTLIIFGTLIAYGYSIFILFFEHLFIQMGLPTHTYFDTSSTILAFILAGNYLETRAILRTSKTIEKLMQLQPRSAIVYRVSNGKKEWVTIPTKEVIINDIIRVDPGAQIPVDGIIIKGSSSINESMVTGESQSISKAIDDTVIGGTINLTHSFEMKANKIGKDTVLAKIIDLVQKAQKSQAPVQRIVDIIASFFVPIVIILSLITFLLWFNFGPQPQLAYALINMIAVLIIACPCALGLAAPISIIVSMGRGAQEGVLIKDAITLETTGKLSLMVFDKTGTLTTGTPSIYDFMWIQDGLSQFPLNNLPAHISPESYLLGITQLVSERSKHPISQAMLTYLKSQDIYIANDITIDVFTDVPGYGIQATINGYVICIGSQRFLEKNNITIPDFLHKIITEWMKKGKTVTFVTVNNILIACYSAADIIRKNAFKTIELLKYMKIIPIMITGDNQQVAESIAQKVGISRVLAQVLPAKKAKEIEMLKKKNFVGMVGDGVNDAPALATAHVGIAMGSGTDIALETADIALLHNNLLLIPFVIRLSNATTRNIYQNLIWAFGYNVLLIPIAMGIFYPFFGIMLHPILAGIAMASSSISVVFNALRLKKFKSLN